MQETYHRALQILPRFAGRSSARTWLLSIARRVAADEIQPANTQAGSGAVADGANHQSEREAGTLLRELVTGLEADCRDAFVLTQVLGLDYAAAAEVCDCPVATICTRVARAREDLVRAMNRHGWPGRSTTGP